ncbi:MAG: AraC family transcriptional regulator [Bacteroidetes bacterium]|nr:AraC family transcriptional regulator [Bacteroidota bacterium]
MLASTDKVAQAIRKSAGFNGQRAIVLPVKVTRQLRKSPTAANLFITDIGFYPKARYHYKERKSGASGHILIYCIDGRGWLHMDGRDWTIERDQYIIIPANMPHRYGSDETHPWSIYWVHFKGEMSKQATDLLSNKGGHYTRPITYTEERIRLFDQIYTILEKGYSDANLQYISMCFWHWLASFGFPDLFQTGDKDRREDVIDRSIAYMRENVHNPVTLKELSAQALLSTSHYSALFKKKTGFPAMEYFNHIKIQKACQYLEFTNSSIKEISYKLGFNDPYYFSRLFSKLMGVSPAAFRNRTKNQP